MAVPPDVLLDHLLSYAEDVSYKRAYELLIGPVPNGRWLNQKHARPAADLAATSGTVSIGKLPVRLDALVVNESADPAGEPSDDHFNRKGYSRDEWRVAFADRSLCKHGEYLIANRIPPRPK